MDKKLVFSIALGAILVLTAVFFKLGIFSLGTLQELRDGWLFPVVMVSAIIDSINPCAFSVLLLTIAFLFSAGKVRSGILKIGGFYILGIFLVYIFIGLGILEALQFFGIPHFVSRLAATILIIFGAVNLINHFYPQFPIKFKIPASAHPRMAKLMEKSSVPAAFLLGVFVALFEFPCTGGPYLVVLGLLHDKIAYFKGLGYLIFYNLIFILPLLIILFIASDEAVLTKFQEWRKEKSGEMRLYSGIAMVILGLVIFAL